jgi:hypothetical protein
MPKTNVLFLTSGKSIQVLGFDVKEYPDSDKPALDHEGLLLVFNAYLPPACLPDWRSTAQLLSQNNKSLCPDCGWRFGRNTAPIQLCYSTLKLCLAW